MKRIFTIATILFINSLAFSQQIGDGLAPGISDYTIPLMSGAYTGQFAIGGIPDVSHNWSHILISRHGNPAYNYQLQIASSLSENDRLFFRKLGTSTNPAWIEVATRGTNNFVGDQIINGNIGIGTSSPSFYEHGGNNKVIEVSNSNTTVHSQSHIILSSGANLPNSSIGTLTWALPNTSSSFKMVGYLDMTTDNASTSSKPSAAMVFATRNETNSFCSEQMRITGSGNVGIGTTNPQNKLDVNGTIHSKEVKVDMIGWSDFVFKKEYNLPTLAEVEKHINEKGHLENIPSENEVLKDGINLGEMNAKLLQKIEELTLYSIQQSKEIEVLKEENKSFKTLSERLLKIEQKMK
ncbi:hypothetical protein [uncultured Flavobacterium sp.]|uniref:hypothetical protein n=1 Tax=uncultured Flavobacterium sp. TaxID=165435 RepID=UPI0029303251|nr:hypothetical protein [uncultured Flavobacterium sp.]